MDVGGQRPDGIGLLEQGAGLGRMGQAEVDDLAVMPQLLNGPHGGVGLELGAVVVGKMEGDQSRMHKRLTSSVKIVLPDYTTLSPAASSPVDKSGSER